MTLVIDQRLPPLSSLSEREKEKQNNCYKLEKIVRVRTFAAPHVLLLEIQLKYLKERKRAFPPRQCFLAKSLESFRWFSLFRIRQHAAIFRTVRIYSTPEIAVGVGCWNLNP